MPAAVFELGASKNQNTPHLSGPAWRLEAQQPEQQPSPAQPTCTLAPCLPQMPQRSQVEASLEEEEEEPSLLSPTAASSSPRRRDLPTLPCSRRIPPVAVTGPCWCCSGAATAASSASPPPCARSSCLAVGREMSGNPAGVDNTFRRKFDKEEYLERARQREREEKEESRKGKDKGPPVQRQPLKHRDYEVDLESRLGKTQVVTPIAPLSQQAGYYCSVCECVVKDSANYLDHINGKKHQRALGMSMRVERASLEQVQKRFESLKKRKDPGSFSEQDLDERILKQQQEEEERKRQRKEKKKEKKKEQAGQNEPEHIDPDVAAMMGFGGFGTSKK